MTSISTSASFGRRAACTALRAGGIVALGEEGGVDLVHRGEVVHIVQENGRFENVIHVRSGSSEDGAHVLERLLGLRADALGERAGGRVDGELTGGDDEAARLDSLRIRADRSRSAVRVNDLFHVMIVLSCINIGNNRENSTTHAVICQTLRARFAPVSKKGKKYKKGA